MPTATALASKAYMLPGQWGEYVGASERDRTSDLLITNQLLYRLSYAGLEEARLN